MHADATRGLRRAFLRALLGALLAGLLVFPVALARPEPVALLAPWLAVGYLLLTSADARRGLAAAALAGALALLVELFCPAGGVRVLAALVSLAVGRSGVLRPQGLLRGLWLELGLSGAGLLLAALLHGPLPGDAALACWAFCLVQASHPLLAGASRREPAVDPFERAVAAAEAVLQAPPRR